MDHLGTLERSDFSDFEKPCKRACQKGKSESKAFEKSFVQEPGSGLSNPSEME